MDTKDNFIKISETSYGKVYRLTCDNLILIFKFFLPVKTLLFLDYNLEPLFKRDRLFISMMTFNKLKSFKCVAKYLPPNLQAISDFELIITIEKRKDFVNLSRLMKECKSITVLPKIYKLTQDWLSIKPSINKPPKKFNNNTIWSLKQDLQIRKPLSYIFQENEIINLIKQLGSVKYFSHGDLQPKNILVTNHELEVVDFEEGFFAPHAWDVGFLWGNLLYLAGCYEKEFLKYYQIWFSLRSGMTKKVRVNFTIITIAIFLMRIYIFPLEKLSRRKKLILRKKVTEMKDLLL